MKNYIYIALILSVCFYNTSLAQSGLKLTDYYHNPIQFNPAYVGVTDGLYVKGFYTTQWLGFDGAPTTQTLDIQKLLHNEKHAIGISVLNDNFGAVQNFNFEANYALHLYLTDELRLSLGLKVGVNSFAINYDKLNIYEPSEAIYNQGNLSELKPQIGTGFYLYQDHWFLGMAVPNVLQSRLRDDFRRSVYVKTPHFYITGGFNFDLSRNLQLRTQVLSQIVKGAPLGLLFTNKISINNKVCFGVNYQPNALFGLLSSIKVTEAISLSYAYDNAISDLSQYTYGNHSIGLSFRLEGFAKKWSDRLEPDKPYYVP